MIFQVIKTSSMFNGDKPHESCIPIEILALQVYSYKSPEDFDSLFGKGEWLKKGINHRLDVCGGIARDIPVKAWGIEINSIEELMAFKDRVNKDLMITTSYIDMKTPCIEICDD